MGRDNADGLGAGPDTSLSLGHQQPGETALGDSAMGMGTVFSLGIVWSLGLRRPL